MAPSQVEAKSLLAIDVGSTRTRALLFDAVESRYRFLGQGAAPTTVEAPLLDVSEGVRLALDELQKITGRILVDTEERLIVPSGTDGSGVDAFVTTFSAGAPLRVFAVGLLEDVSLSSARNLVSSTYAQVVGSLTLNDRRKIEEQIDTIIRLRPDLVLVAGGTDGGANSSVLKLIEPVGLACYLTPERQRPGILFAGNSELVDEIQSSLESIAPLHFASNLRPSLDVQQLGPARTKLVEVYRQIRSRDIRGVKELSAWASDQLIPTATAFGRVIRFLSRVYDPSKGVLGVDLGSSSVVVAAAFAGDLRLSVFPDRGMGSSMPGILEETSVAAVGRWLPFPISADELYDYAHNKTLAPASLPVSERELALDQALAREALNSAIRRAQKGFPDKATRPRADLLPWFEPIVVTGAVFTQAPTLGQSLLMLLDAVQPTGITTLVLDRNNLSPALGAASVVNPVLTVQTLESGTFQNLGTVISPVGQARRGSPVLHARLVYEDGSEMKLEIKHGTLEVLPLPVGKAARLHLQPLQRHDIGMGGPGRGGSLRVVGGALGVVIDARGRPLLLPEEADRRYELLKKWSWTLGG